MLRNRSWYPAFCRAGLLAAGNERRGGVFNRPVFLHGRQVFTLDARQRAGAERRKKVKIFYVCDKRACEKCTPVCRYTTDIRHAANFRVMADGSMWENHDDAPEGMIFCDDLQTGRRTVIYPEASPSSECTQEGEKS